MDDYIITITRDFGSLGRSIARRLSELLHIQYYDRDIVEAAAKRMKMPVSFISDEEEKGSNFFKQLFPLGKQPSEWQERIFQTQKSIIKDFAEQGSCIIVGRCADGIFAGRPRTMHVHIYAPYEDRYRNCVEVLKMPPDEARRLIGEVDKARKSYNRQYAKFPHDDPAHKDMLLNSSLLGVEGTARLLAKAAKLKFQLPNEMFQEDL